MLEKSGRVVGGHPGLDDLRRIARRVAGGGDACAELVVVGEIVDQRREAADAVQCLARDGEGGAEAEVDAAFDAARGEDAGDEVGGDAESFHARADGRLLARQAVGAAAIGRGDHADGAIARRRWRESRHDGREVVGRDDDVAVVDDDVGIARMRQHLDEVRDLAVGAERLRALDDADGVAGKLFLKPADSGDGGIVQRADAEEDFVFACIFLAAVAGEGGVHLVIEAVDRLEDADAGRVGGPRGGAGYGRRRARSRGRGGSSRCPPRRGRW